MEERTDEFEIAMAITKGRLTDTATSMQKCYELAPSIVAEILREVATFFDPLPETKE